MKRTFCFASLALTLCLCTAWFQGAPAVHADDKSPQDHSVQNPRVTVIDGVKQETPSKRTANTLTDADLKKLESETQPPTDSEAGDGGEPRGDVPGACCDIFSGNCSIRTATACANVGGLFQGNGTTCSPNNPCVQPIDCDVPAAPNTALSQLPPDPGTIAFTSYLSDVDANQLALVGFLTSGGDITTIRFWGLEINGATNCTRTNNNFNFTFFADAGILGGGPTNPTPEVVAQFNNVPVTRLRAANYALDGNQMSYNGQLLWEYTATLPQRVALLNGWLAIQAAADGGPCNFRWISSPFGPGNLIHNGVRIVDPNALLQDVAVCISGTFNPVNGACCDDSVQGGSCQDNVPANQCTDFAGGDHRFRVDQTCAQLNPTCGSVTGSCCVGANCSILTGAQCAAAGGSFIAFEDCTPNPCVGACCLGSGECQELTSSDCGSQGGQYFGDGSLCSQTACPGTGRCCFNAGTQCEIRTQAACALIAGSRWDAGITCATPCPIPPINDLCVNAIPIQCGETITVDNTEATTDASDPLFPCRVGGPQAGFGTIWFTFVPTTSSATIRTCSSLAPATDSILQVFSGECGALGTQLACNDDTTGCGTNGLRSSVCVTNLIVGNTYYIEVAAWAAGAVGPYAVEVICPGLTCASTGACCLPTGNCAILNEVACATQGGTYNGDATTCGTLGACCISETLCVQSNQQCCAEAGGAFLGEGVSCGESAGEPVELSASPNAAIGVATAISTINVPTSFTLGDVNVRLNIAHTWIGDLIADLEHGGTTVRIIDQPGFPIPDPTDGCAADNLVNIILDDSGTGGAIENQCVANLTSPPNYTPNNPLSAFNGMNANGAWTLTVSDAFTAADDGTLISWAIILDGTGFSPCDTDPGACCFSEGTGDCQQLNAIDCAQAGGRFQGGNTPCSGDICIPRGACCNTFDGSCQQLTQEACQALPNSNFLGDFTSCGNCPVILGACCLPDTSCIANVRINQCTPLGGSFLPLTGCGEAAGDPTTYQSNPNAPITDNNNTNVNQNVADSFIIGDVNLFLDITHTFLADLDIDLSHDGVTVRVMQDQCGANDNMQITFDDEGSAIVCASPTVGTYQPFSPLSAFDGQSATGVWTLNVFDDAGADQGTLVSWSLIIDRVGINPCDTEPGACCFSEGIGDCQLLNAVDCASASGRFQGGGTACTGDICVPRGACCNTVTGACQQLTEEACQASPNGNFLGDFTPCSQCPVVNGSCCLPNLQCVPNTQFNSCTSQGGTFNPGGECATVGACCTGVSGCTVATQACCLAAGGAYLGNGTNCGDAAGNPTTLTSTPNLAIPDAVAAGINDTINVADSFTVGDVNIVVNITHTWVGDVCVSLTHDGVTAGLIQRMGAAGACPAGAPFGCATDNLVNIVLDDEGTGGAIETQCVENLTSPPNYTPNNPLSVFNGLNSSGSWTLNVVDNAGGDLGTFVSWSLVVDGVGVNPCDTDPGACCFTETLAGCQLLNAVDCSTAGGRFQGGGTACAGDICVPRGACCNTVTGACQQLTQAACQASPNGNYLGNFTPCSQCPVVTGTCCLPNLQCLPNSQFSSCTAQGGSFNPGGNCTTTGACCLGDGSCNIATQACCLAAGGAYLGDGLNCGESAGNPTTYTANPNAPITDNTNTTVTQNIADSFTIGDVNVEIIINHTFLADLDIDLIHNGVTVRVMQDQCGANDNMQITFDDEAAPIVCAQPTVGTYQPFSPLSAFDGINASGLWTLNVFDDAAADQGTLVSWSLIIDGLGANPCDTEPGACCFSETVADCQLLDAVACASAGGRFIGGGTACSGNVCQILGACCLPVTGACQQLTSAQCSTQGGNWLGGFTNCSGCPIILGACCLPGGGCQAGVQFNPCNAQGGSFLPGQNCGDSAGNPQTFISTPNVAVPDNAPAGTSDTINVPASFVLGDVNVRLNITHTFVGDLCVSLSHNATTVDMIQRMGAVVAGTPCHVGTPFGCAQDNLNNIVLDDEGTLAIESQCVLNLTSPPNYIPNNPLSAFDGQDSAGTWTLTVIDNAATDTGTLISWELILDGQGVNPCNATPGACCVGQLDTDCSIQTAADCAALSGRYLGAGTTCTPGVCIIRGACCDSLNVTCVETTQAECVGPNRTYQGNFTTCATANCPALTGACCLGTGACQNARTLPQCNAAGGTWSGANSTCETVTGACCLSASECVITSSVCCQGLGGSFEGVGVPCGGPANNPTTYTDTANVAIPNNNPTGLSRSIVVPNSYLIADVDLSVNITIQAVGQITVNITHNGVTRSVIQRIGSPAISAFGCLQNNINVRLDDEGTGGPIENACSGGVGTPLPTSPPSFTPNQTLSAFDGMDAAGTWTIQVIDADAFGIGTLVSWSLHIDGFGAGVCASSTECTTCPGDTNGDGVLDGRDVDSFSDCLIAGGAGCPCGDMNNDSAVNLADVPGFVQTLLAGSGSCGSVPVCSTCLGDSSGDGVIDGRDCAAFVNCLLNSPGGCPCSDINGNSSVDLGDIQGFVDKLLNQTGSCN
ncbi:MAG: proprotein convertase P-domain-containing protein [Phycisphaerae bacterium]|nr:proprotein convertase P-domain-containing protein [Phycisphaerae bacterium]